MDFLRAMSQRCVPAPPKSLFNNCSPNRVRAGAANRADAGFERVPRNFSNRL
jgi:hypothetical protein